MDGWMDEWMDGCVWGGGRGADESRRLEESKGGLGGVGEREEGRWQGRRHLQQQQKQQQPQQHQRHQSLPNPCASFLYPHPSAPSPARPAPCQRPVNIQLLPLKSSQRWYGCLLVAAAVC
eukprot:323758-Chlamydomonas_euryale.AAC.1